MDPAFRLRPLTVGDILDEAIRLFRRNFRLLITISAIGYIPLVGLFALIPILMVSPDPDSLGVSLLVSLLVLGILLTGFLTAMFVASIHAISEIYLGRPMTVSAAYEFAIGRILPLIGLGIIVNTAVFLMFATFIGIPFAIFFLVAWGFSYLALIVEGAGIRQAMGRSRTLVRGNWWRVVGIALLFSILGAIANAIITVPGATLAGVLAAVGSEETSLIISLLSNLLGLVGGVIVGPIYYCGWVLLYYDLRVRKEGLDLAMQADQIDRRPETGEAFG